MQETLAVSQCYARVSTLLNMAGPNRPKVQRWPTAHSQSTRGKCTWENNRWLPFPILQFPTETKRINDAATVGCCMPSAQGKYCAMRGWCKSRRWSGRVPGVCGECFETSPVPSALCQSVGCQHTNRVVVRTCHQEIVPRHPWSIFQLQHVLRLRVMTNQVEHNVKAKMAKACKVA